MMSDRQSAVRYARALFDVALKESDVLQVGRDLDALAGLMRDTPDLARVATARGISEMARRNVMDQIAARLELSAPARKLVVLLAGRGRLTLFSELVAAYHARVLAHQDVVRADVTSAVPLSADQEAALAQGLSHVTGKQVEMRVATDPAIIGGVVARVGGTVYDGSVRTQLTKMRDQLVAGS
jgi:F-type H+-transporting ATPase subunit delta